jgi:hypothetical protein
VPIKHSHPLLPLTQGTPLPKEVTFHPTAITLGATTLPRLAHTDVYMDDFMVIAQSPNHLPLLNTLLHTIYDVLQEPTSTNRRPIVSASKMAKGDATFSTTKRLLGWDINTATMTITLPEHRMQGIQQQLQHILRRKRVSRRLYQKLLGTLRSSAPSLYGANNPFSSLQYAVTETRHNRIRITPLTRAILRDWITLVDTAAHHAVPIHTVVPHPPPKLSVPQMPLKRAWEAAGYTSTLPPHPHRTYYGVFNFPKKSSTPSFQHIIQQGQYLIATSN